MIPNEESTSLISNEEEARYDEEWEVVLNNGSKYQLSKIQAWGLRQEIANGNRGIVMYKTFAISIPYILEFTRVRRFLKDTLQLSARASEEPFVPMSPEKWAEMRKKFAWLAKKKSVDSVLASKDGLDKGVDGEVK